jgi:hypothetical protein
MTQSGLLKPGAILLMQLELRQLVRHKQAVAIIDTALPIKFSYPPFIQAAPEALSLPLYKGTPHIINLKSAHKANRHNANQSADSSNSSLTVNKSPAPYISI